MLCPKGLIAMNQRCQAVIDRFLFSHSADFTGAEDGIVYQRCQANTVLPGGLPFSLCPKKPNKLNMHNIAG